MMIKEEAYYIRPNLLRQAWNVLLHLVKDRRTDKELDRQLALVLVPDDCDFEDGQGFNPTYDSYSAREDNGRVFAEFRRRSIPSED